MPQFPIVHDIKGKFMQLPRDHVHAYVIELEHAVVVVDTTLAVSSASEVRAKADSLGKPIEAVLLTHGHPDHYTGLVKFADLPRLASQGCLDFALREDEEKAATAKGYLGDDYPDERLFPDQIIGDGHTVTFGGVEFRFTDLGPGESDSDGIWSFASDGVTHAFVGDAVANHCHCFFRDGHTYEWLANLDRLERDLTDATKIYVGHGESPTTKEMIEWQRGYIKAFQDAVAQIEDRSTPVPRSTQESIIASVKKYLPNDATLFLLDYELEITIPELWRSMAAHAT
jgi:glyoxylase-like metal-dependent hydrolase (beta-lactamase superfamily II)